MTAFYAPDPINSTQLIPGGNVPASGGLLFCYLVGSTTKQNTYTDASASTARTNPIVLDSGGNVPGNGEVWITSTAKFVLAPSNDSDPPASPYWSRDNLPGVNDPSQLGGEWITSGLTPTFVSGSSFIFSGDQTGTFTPGRRLKTLNTGGTRYSTIATSAFSASTTIGIASDTIGVDSGLSTVSYGILNPKNTSLPLIVSVLNFGAKGDGVTDDTAAFNLSRIAALGKTLFISGTPLISSALSLMAREHWVFDGAIGNAASGRPGSYLIKKSTLNAALVTFESGSDGSLIEGGGIVGQVGNGGDGFVIKANGVQLSRTYVTLMGNDGIRIGSATLGANANEFDLYHPICIANVRHGIYIFDDNSSDTIDANAGVIYSPFCQSNGGDGLKIEKGTWNTVVAPGLEGNTGSGIRMTGSGALYTTVIGGDIEGNTEDVTIGANAQNNSLINVNYTTFSDVGLSTLLLGPVKTKLPLIAYGVQNSGAFNTFSASDTTPSVLGGTCWQTANSSGTTVTNFDDGVNGQVIIVRLDGNTAITHNASFIRLTAGRSITAGDYSSDSLICLVRLSSIWFELWRSQNKIIGTVTNDSASAGYVGEYFTPATLASGSALSLTSPNALDVTSFTLTAGDWDVWGVIDYLAGGATTFTVMKSGISTTSATIGAQDTFTNLALAGTLAAASDMAQATPVVRISLSASTLVYLVAQATFAVSTLKVYGTIFARRRR